MSIQATIPKRYKAETEAIVNQELNDLLNQFDPYFTYSDDYDYVCYQREISKAIRSLKAQQEQELGLCLN